MVTFNPEVNKYSSAIFITYHLEDAIHKVTPSRNLLTLQCLRVNNMTLIFHRPLNRHFKELSRVTFAWNMALKSI